MRLRFNGPVGNGAICCFLSHEDSVRIGDCREPPRGEMDPLQSERHRQQGRCRAVAVTDNAQHRTRPMLWLRKATVRGWLFFRHNTSRFFDMISDWRYYHAIPSLLVAVHPGPSSWYEMAECADWRSALPAGSGHGLPAGRQYPILCVRCGQNHGAAVLSDICDLLYSKLLSAGAQ